MDHVPYMFVIGKNEAAKGQVTIRSRVNKSHEGMLPAADAVAKIIETVAKRELPEGMKSRGLPPALTRLTLASRSHH